MFTINIKVLAALEKLFQELFSKFSLVVYSEPVDEAFKAMGLE